MLRAVHQAIGKIGQDYETMQFNTAISALMTLSNEMQEYRVQVSSAVWVEAKRALVLLLAPLAPHLTEALWQSLVESGDTSCAPNTWSAHQQPWPEYSDDLAAEERVTVVVQVNGRLRERIEMPVGMTQEEVLEEALTEERVTAALAGQQPIKVIHVPNRLINLVTK